MKYKVVILPIDCEEEWEPPRVLQTGVECDSVFMITFVDGQAEHGIGMHINLEELKEAMKSDCPEILMARAACAIAEAEMKAMDLMKQADAYDSAENVVDYIERMCTDGGIATLKNHPGMKIIKIERRRNWRDPEEGEDE